MAALVCRGPVTPAWSEDVSARAASAVVATGAAPVSGPQRPPAGVLAWDERAGSRDVDCLSQAVYYEARGESLAGQQAVAQVVLNRARHPGFPKSICAVVFQTCQFSFVCDGAMGRPLEPVAWRRARAVAARALDGYVMAAVGRALSFHVAEGDAAPGAVARLGRHAFYVAQNHSPLQTVGWSRHAEIQPAERETPPPQATPEASDYAVAASPQTSVAPAAPVAE